MVARLLGSRDEGRPIPAADPARWLGGGGAGDGGPGPSDPARVAAAFLVTLAGQDAAVGDRAASLLDAPPAGTEELARLFREGLAAVPAELEERARGETGFVDRLVDVAEALEDTDDDARLQAAWSVFHPEAAGIRGHEGERERDLRDRRTIRILRPNPDPIRDPLRQVLITSNVLFTIPTATSRIAELPLPADLRAAVEAATREPQRFWFDHPIQVGVGPAENELLQGLRGLDAAIAFERGRRAGADPGAATHPGPGAVTDDPVPCVLSVSVTHTGLHPVARRYVEDELARTGGLRHVVPYVFTETETRRLIEDVLVPAGTPAGTGAGTDTGAVTGRGSERDPGVAPELASVFGVDGEYGRHYSFLKAIAALWHVLIDDRVRATFKIDLDQVFPQEVLVAETGRSAFEHLATPTWGAEAADADGRPIDLGMIAGALVNERDIGRSLFTPDIDYPARSPSPDEVVFWKALPQALSTRAEMMERHDGPERDGLTTALERIHVTGGTNGILVDALRRHRPFTPTFVGRAEDQAYVLSTFTAPGPRLAYAHAAGLVMRHDKEAYAGQAIAAAAIGKLLGDDVRLLVFSAYADALAGGGDGSAARAASLKALTDPFTGSFISRLPVSVVLLRFALRILALSEAGDHDRARRIAQEGAVRLREAIATTADRAALRERVDRERRAWDRYYETLDALEAGIRAGEPRSLRLRARARSIVASCRISPGMTA